MGASVLLERTWRNTVTFPKCPAEALYIWIADTARYFRNR